MKSPQSAAFTCENMDAPDVYSVKAFVEGEAA